MRQISASVIAAAIAVIAVTGCASSGDMMHGAQVKLNGAQEVPPVSTTAAGSGAIMVAADHGVSGSITTAGIEGKAAHIHQGAAGVNGGVIVPLTKTGDATWSVPAGAKLSDEQYAAYLAGNMYVNVHSAANPNGEIRGQLNAK